jgi:ribosomal protein S21
MGIEVKKQERETTQSLIRRFTRKVQQSGILVRARESRFRKPTKSRQMKKRAALRREKVKEEYQKLAKLGQLKE